MASILPRPQCVKITETITLICIYIRFGLLSSAPQVSWLSAFYITPVATSPLEVVDWMRSVTKLNLLSSWIPKESWYINSPNPKIIPCNFHVSGVMLGFQIFGVTFFIIRMHYGFLGCEYASVFFLVLKILVLKIPKMRPCTWCVLPCGDSSPFRQQSGSCAEISLQNASFVDTYFSHMHRFCFWRVLLF